MAREEDQERAANDELVRKMKEQVESGGDPKPTDDDDLVITAGGDDDDDDDEPQRETVDQRPSRKERRTNRFREMEERAAAAERKAQELEEKLERRLAEFNQQRAAPPPPPPELTLQSVYKEQDELHAEYTEAYQRYQGNLPAHIQQQFTSRARDIDQKKLRAAFAEEMGRRPAGPSPEDIRMEVLKAKNVDVLGNQRTAKWAHGEYLKLLSQGAPDNESTLEKACENARYEFKLGGRGAPTRENKARYTGQSASRGGSATEKSSGSVSIKMTKEYKKMADAFAPYITDERKRYQHWVNKVGRHLTENS